jgi:predicted RNase H-like HicB family nuclease
MMKKILAVVRRTEDGYRGYVPKLPGCEIRAATAEQAEADLTAAARAHVAAGEGGTNGYAAPEVEFAVVVEPPLPEHLRGASAEVVARSGWELPSDEMLEAMLHPDEHEWVELDDDFLRELEEMTEQPTNEAPI